MTFGEDPVSIAEGQKGRKHVQVTLIGEQEVATGSLVSLEAVRTFLRVVSYVP